MSKRLLLVAVLLLGSRASLAAAFTPLGFLHNKTGTPSEALAVSADGSVVVGYAGLAFRWTAGTGMVALPRLEAADREVEATGVSADGSVVVGTAYERAEGHHASARGPAEGLRHGTKGHIIEHHADDDRAVGRENLQRRRATGVDPSGGGHGASGVKRRERCALIERRRRIDQATIRRLCFSGKPMRRDSVRPGWCL